MLPFIDSHSKGDQTLIEHNISSFGRLYQNVRY